jgi:lysine-N-methylase
MKTFAPNYYEKFRCIAGECRHSCCIGWDVYIDDETLEKYKALGGEIGETLRTHLVKKEDGICLAMCEGGRCPMLNSQGLCEIILDKGESYISEVCREHPRFYNFFSDHAEVGLGLSCEEAARIILSQKEKAELVVVCEDEAKEEELWEIEAEISAKRARIFAALQNRSEPISARADKMLAICGAHFPQKNAEEWAEIFRSLEMLDGAWADALDMLAHADMSTEMEEFSVPLE